MKKDKISIIIPVYNEKENLGFALFMIYKQTVKDNLEVIIVDDCSDDNYEEELQLYRKKGMDIKCIRNQENMGASVSRQRGVDISTGDWVCFMDADDMITPNYIEKIRENIKENSSKKVFSWLIYNQKLKAAQFCFHLGSFAIKKDFLYENRIRFHEKLRFFEDEYYVNIVTPIAVYKDEYKIIPDILYQYNDNKNSTLYRCGYKKDKFEEIRNQAKLYRVMWFLDNKPEILENYDALIKKTNEIKEKELLDDN